MIATLIEDSSQIPVADKTTSASAPETPRAEPAAEVELQVAPQAPLSYRELMVQRLEKMSAQENKVLFEGEWITPDEARARYRRMRWAGLRMFLELSLLLGGMLVAAYSLLLLFLWYVGIL